MKQIISKIVNASTEKANLNTQFFTHAEQKEIQSFAKAAKKTDLFFDIEGNELTIKRGEFVDGVESGSITGVHIQTTDGGAVKLVRVSNNNQLIRIA